jgi:hypothetical protein
VATPGASGRSGPLPAGVWVPATFFAVAGLMEIMLGVMEAPRPIPFWPVWEAIGRGLLHFLLAWGLWRRIALCRTIAMVYCLAALVTYAIVLLLALFHAPLRFPGSVVVQSLYQVPSCALLFPHLRSARAAALFPRPLFGG